MAKIENRTIAILGANGRLGRCAVAAFHAAGWNVRAVSRNGDAQFGSEIETIAGDMLSKSDAIRSVQDCAFVFNGLNPRYADWSAQLPQLTQNVIAAVRSQGAIHLFPGNVYNYGANLPEILSVQTPQVGDHRKAALRIGAEAQYRRAAEEHGVRTIILRAGDFFGGSGTGSWFDLAIAAKVDKGRMTYPGPLDRPHSWAYLPDLAQAFVRLAENAHGLDSFAEFHFEGHIVTGGELREAIELAMQRPMKVSGIPWPLVRIAGFVRPMMREIHEVSYLWRRPHRMSSRELEAVTGTLPSTPFQVAVAHALDDLGIKRKTTLRDARVLPSMAA